MMKSTEPDQTDNPMPPIHPRMAGRAAAEPMALSAAERVPEPDAIRPESSPEWRELFKHIRRAVDRLRE